MLAHAGKSFKKLFQFYTMICCKKKYKCVLLYKFRTRVLLKEVFSKPCQISWMEVFVKIVNARESFTIFPKSFILDVSSECSYGLTKMISQNHTL